MCHENNELMAQERKIQQSYVTWPRLTPFAARRVLSTTDVFLTCTDKYFLKELWLVFGIDARGYMGSAFRRLDAVPTVSPVFQLVQHALQDWIAAQLFNLPSGVQIQLDECLARVFKRTKLLQQGHAVALDVHVFGALPQDVDDLLIVGTAPNGVNDGERKFALNSTYKEFSFILKSRNFNFQFIKVITSVKSSQKLLFSAYYLEIIKKKGRQSTTPDTFIKNLLL
jgi:hypothetical protein